MWYVIWTVTGKEEELITLIDKMVDSDVYESAFSIVREMARRESGRYVLYKEIMFKGYVFVKTSSPEDFFYQLKKVPQFSKLLHDESFLYYTPTEAEEKFLKNLICESKEHVVRMSVAKVDEEGKIVAATEPLGLYLDKMVRQRLRKRYAVIEEELLGGKKRIQLGFWLERDLKE